MAKMYCYKLDRSHLPTTFKTLQIPNKSVSDDCYTLRANLESEKDITIWVSEFGKRSKTTWNFRRSSGRQIISREYVCHHSNFRKVLKSANGCNNNGISKNANCSARIKISINTTGSKRSRDPYVRDGLYAAIRIFKIHTHTLRTAQMLRYLQDRTGVLREQFHQYFTDNMTAAEAKRFHEQKLELENASLDDMASGNVNPTTDTVYYWYKEWRLINLGLRTRKKPLSKPVSTSVVPVSPVLISNIDSVCADDTAVLHIPQDNAAQLYNEDIKTTANILIKKLQNFSTASNSSDLKKFRETLESISTKEMLLTFLHSVPITMHNCKVELQ